MAAALKEVGRKAALEISHQLLHPHPQLERVATLVMLGPPGVGKGTYSTRLAQKFGFAHISMGDLIRDEIKRQSEPGRLVHFFTYSLQPLHLILIPRTHLVHFYTDPCTIDTWHSANCSTHSLTHPLTHSLTHSLTYSSLQKSSSLLLYCLFLTYECCWGRRLWTSVECAGR